MKMKMNKACDLSSISVLPPNTRKSSVMPTALQGSQLRSQPSQQSFSHGISSQHAMLSQFSQTSLNEVVTTGQRLSSQERESSVKRVSSLPPPRYAPDESQVQPATSSGSLMRQWSSSAISGQLSEGPENRIRLMETSLKRFGMILDSIQSDIMHTNKGIKEVTIEMDCLRKKIIAQDDTLQSMNKGLEEIKDCLDERMKSLSDQLNENACLKRLEEIFSIVSALPQMIEVSVQKSEKELLNGFRVEMQDIERKRPSSLSPTGSGSHETVEIKPQLALVAVQPPKISAEANFTRKLNTGGFKSVKKGPVTFADRIPGKKLKRRRVSSPEENKVEERHPRIVVESDEDSNGGLSFLLEGDTDGYFIEEVREETQRILRKARRRKRKCSNVIIID